MCVRWGCRDVPDVAHMQRIQFCLYTHAVGQNQLGQGKSSEHLAAGMETGVKVDAEQPLTDHKERFSREDVPGSSNFKSPHRGHCGVHLGSTESPAVPEV